MPILHRFTWRDGAVIAVLLGVIAAMSIPLVAAVRADTQRAQAEVTLKDLHRALPQAEKLPELVKSISRANTPVPAAADEQPASAKLVFRASR